MGRHIIKLPDVGEGIAEAELVEWAVRVGDVISEDDLLASVMTDKATVEIPSSVAGKISWLGGEVGDVLQIGADLVHIEVVGGEEQKVMEGRPEEEASSEMFSASQSREPKRETATQEKQIHPQAGSNNPARMLAAPSVRRLAMETGLDLSQIAGTGPSGRVLREDVEKALAEPGAAMGRARTLNQSSMNVKVAGLRRRISERMSTSWTNIPHITIIEEVDVSKLEQLRASMNDGKQSQHPKLTVLPFIMRAIVISVRRQPEMNATFDDSAGTITQWGGVHVGIATQTDSGLMVPVVRHCESLSIWSAASEVRRLSDTARQGAVSREELTGSTITISSLGRLGAIATTPIINYPEVTIVGVNKISVRPHWNGNAFEPRKMMNLSCSFDHRVIDGWNAAAFVNSLKQLLEEPALLFAGMEE